MQNAVNYLSPFLFDGKPIANGRVYFVKADTSALTFEHISGLDSAFFVPVYDKNGHEIENPLTLNDEGTWDWANGKQPFVEDGIDFKMIVCRPTGISPDINDETPAWEVCYTITSIAERFEVEYDGIVTVGSIAELRTQDPSAGAVLVLGYGSANDFCPPRIFTWKRQNLNDNGGTRIRSSVEGQTNAGTWVCEPSFYVDVRWFGINPNLMQLIDEWAVINSITQNYYPNLPVYFPKGSYFLSTSIEFVGGLILDKDARLFPINNNITVKALSFENRGGGFYTSTSSSGAKIFPVLKGTIYTSWMESPRYQLDTELGANLDDVTEVVFDTNISAGSLEISNKFVLVEDGINVDGVTFTNCVVVREGSARVTASYYYLKNNALIETVIDNGVPRLKFSTLGENGSQFADFGKDKGNIRCTDLFKVFAAILECKQVQATDHTFKATQDYYFKKVGDYYKLKTEQVESVYEQIPYFTNHKIPAYGRNLKFARLEFIQGGILKVKEPFGDRDYGIVGDNGVYDLNSLVTSYSINLFGGAEEWDLFIDTSIMIAQAGGLQIVLPTLATGEIKRIRVCSSDDNGMVQLVVNDWLSVDTRKPVYTYAGGLNSGVVTTISAPFIKKRPINIFCNNVNDWYYNPFMI